MDASATGLPPWFDVLDIDARAVGWRDDAPSCELRPRRIVGEEARTLAHALHARQATATPGEVLRPASYWNRFTQGRSSGRLDAALGLGSDAAGSLQCVAVGERGLVAYRITSRWSADATPRGTVVVTDVLATDVEAAAALRWHLLGVDLVTDIHFPRVPVDDPVRWWVADACRLRPRRLDGLWLRPLDVPQLLEARRWSGSGALTLAVHDREGYAEGTFRLDVDAGRASCQRTSGEEMDARGTAHDQAKIADRLLGTDLVENPAVVGFVGGGEPLIVAGLVIPSQPGETNTNQLVGRTPTMTPQSRRFPCRGMMNLAGIGGPRPCSGMAAASFDDVWVLRMHRCHPVEPVASQVHEPPALLDVPL